MSEDEPLFELLDYNPIDRYNLFEGLIDEFALEMLPLIQQLRLPLEEDTQKANQREDWEDIETIPHIKSQPHRNLLDISEF